MINRTISCEKEQVSWLSKPKKVFKKLEAKIGLLIRRKESTFERFYFRELSFLHLSRLLKANYDKLLTFICLYRMGLTPNETQKRFSDGTPN